MITISPEAVDALAIFGLLIAGCIVGLVSERISSRLIVRRGRRRLAAMLNARDGYAEIVSYGLARSVELRAQDYREAHP